MTARNYRVVFCLLMVVLLATRDLAANDWLGFRGGRGNTYLPAAKLPDRWDDSSGIAWKIELPGRGLSSPIVVGNKVYLTASSGPQQRRLHVMCFQADNGSLVWDRQFLATGRSVTHADTSCAAPTPTTDGERIFAFFSSNDVICLSLSGELQWCRGLTYDYPNVSNSLGMASSPVVVGETLILQAENDTESKAFGLDVLTGADRWVLDRPRKANWTSPLAAVSQGQPVALLQSSRGIDWIEPMTGKLLQSYSEGAATIPSSTVSEGNVYVPSHGVTALSLDWSDTGAKQLWRGNKLNPGTATPAIAHGKIYLLNSAGVLICAALNSGETEWQLRLQGPFSGSPVVVGNRLFAVSKKGIGVVVDLSGEKGAILSEFEFGETIQCTPAVSSDAMFIRSNDHLWKIAELPK